MKKILVICTIILIVLSVTACGKSEDETPKTPNNSDTGEVNVYSTLIELLRGEIETLKKEQSETKAEYEAKIEELLEIQKRACAVCIYGIFNLISYFNLGIVCAVDIK